MIKRNELDYIELGDRVMSRMTRIVPEAGYLVRKALPGDWTALVWLRLAIKESLRERGIDQWQDTTRGLEQLGRYFTRGEVSLLTDGDGKLAGAFALTRHWDPVYWADDPERDQFLYLHKVMTAPELRGQGTGALIVKAATRAAHDSGSWGLRLNCQQGNAGLQAQWERLGFRYVRTVPESGSGVLMESRIVLREGRKSAALGALRDGIKGNA